MNPDRLARRARRAYELGRLTSNARRAWVVAPVVVATSYLGPAPGATAFTGALLVLMVVLMVGFLWAGQGWARGVRLGFFVGCVALLLPLMACRIGICPLGPSPLLLLLCSAAGLVAGAVVAVGAFRFSGPQLPFLLAAGSMAAATTALGCVVAGLAGILSMSLGLAVVAAPVMVVVRMQ